MFDIRSPPSSLEQEIIDCLRNRGELEWEEMASLLGKIPMDIYDPIGWLMGRGLLNYHKVEGIGKYPATQSWGLKFYLTE